MMSSRKGEWTSPELPLPIAGSAYHGSFQVEEGMIRVSYRGRSKETQLGGHSAYPEELARLLLSELIRETPSV